jgi:hypothetical protein
MCQEKNSRKDRGKRCTGRESEFPQQFMTEDGKPVNRSHGQGHRAGGDNPHPYMIWLMADRGIGVPSALLKTPIYDSIFSTAAMEMRSYLSMERLSKLR